MSQDSEDRKLLELGRELSEQLLRQSDRRDGEELFKARRRALQTITPHARGTIRSGGWLPATAVAAIAAFTMVMIVYKGDGSLIQNEPDEHSTFLTKQFADDDAPWSENLDMLQNMDFTLWLDMADPQDAG